jgi:hypothetical protein
MDPRSEESHLPRTTASLPRATDGIPKMTEPPADSPVLMEHLHLVGAPSRLHPSFWVCFN